MTPRLAEALALFGRGRFDEAHDLVQAEESPLAAYLHGAIHREEGDLANARYWFRRAGDLPARFGFDPTGVNRETELAALAAMPKD